MTALIQSLSDGMKVNIEAQSGLGLNRVSVKLVSIIDLEFTVNH